MQNTKIIIPNDRYNFARKITDKTPNKIQDIIEEFG